MKRLILSVAVIAIILGVTGIPARKSYKSLGHVLADKFILYPGSPILANLRYVERVPAMTGESRELAEHLKIVAAR